MKGSSSVSFIFIVSSAGLWRFDSSFLLQHLGTRLVLGVDLWCEILLGFDLDFWRFLDGNICIIWVERIYFIVILSSV